jgi:hypothetical protein
MKIVCDSSSPAEPSAIDPTNWFASNTANATVTSGSVIDIPMDNLEPRLGASACDTCCSSMIVQSPSQEAHAHQVDKQYSTLWGVATWVAIASQMKASSEAVSGDPVAEGDIAMLKAKPYMTQNFSCDSRPLDARRELVHDYSTRR